jgi:hypothetical protein
MRILRMIINTVVSSGIETVSAHTRFYIGAFVRPWLGIRSRALFTADRRHTAAFSNNTDLTGVVTLYAAAGSRSLSCRRGQWFSRSLCQMVPSPCGQKLPAFLKHRQLSSGICRYGGGAGLGILRAVPSVTKLDKSPPACERG